MNAYTEADLFRAATAGIRAPSMHNSQPWRFRLRDGAIEVLADPARQLAVADSTGWAACSMISQPIEVPAAREQLRKSLGGSGVPQLALRIGYGQPGRATPRRGVEDVITE